MSNRAWMRRRRNRIPKIMGRAVRKVPLATPVTRRFMGMTVTMTVWAEGDPRAYEE